MVDMKTEDSKEADAEPKSLTEGETSTYPEQEINLVKKTENPTIEPETTKGIREVFDSDPKSLSSMATEKWKGETKEVLQSHCN